MKTEKAAGWARLTAAEKVTEYNNANREVAILCNHQRSVSKAQETQLENLGGKLQTLKDQKKILKKMLKRLNEGNDKGLPVKKNEKDAKEKSDKALEKAKKMKEKAKTNEEKIAATEKDEKAKAMRKEVQEMKFNQAHLWEKIPSKDQVSKRITNWTEKIAKMELNIKHKDDNKEVALGTSKVRSVCWILPTLFFNQFLIIHSRLFFKLNYMDPRISVAWCKRNDVPIEKIFSRTMRDKFNWAMAVPSDWQFNEEIAKQG